LRVYPGRAPARGRERAAEDARGDQGGGGQAEVLADPELERGRGADGRPRERHDEEPEREAAAGEEEDAEGEDGRGAGRHAERGRVRVDVAEGRAEERVPHRRVRDDGAAEEQARAGETPPRELEPLAERGLDEERRLEDEQRGERARGGVHLGEERPVVGDADEGPRRREQRGDDPRRGPPPAQRRGEGHRAEQVRAELRRPDRLVVPGEDVEELLDGEG
jgi:hypothetical protein